MNKINKVRKGEVRIYKGMTYVAVPEIKEDHCTGCCFYNEGSCLIRDPDHVDFPDCHDSGMIWMQKDGMHWGLKPGIIQHIYTGEPSCFRNMWRIYSRKRKQSKTN